ncbi:aldo/keto reductase [Xylophilus sp.]|uniref:aldo/keto reductase n=1 Tax=Xylophilus sp. TaxID=2653893 RepID=UPI0013BA3B25|nr:aldo/keto reductase [Xylophilus sp.]KAF1044924.1 MAG: Protein tas [Xylophilus sp.]
MQYTRLGSAGLAVSRLTLGTMTFGYQTSDKDSAAILDRAAEAGVTLIDTADIYPYSGGLPLAGRTEEILGRWLQGRRHRFLIATKGAAQVGPAAWDRGNSRKHLLAAVDASLRRLGVDDVDLYQLHWDDPDTPLDETLEALDTIVRSGRAAYAGVSNFLAWRLARALGRSEANRWSRVVSVQARYNLLFRENERELLPLVREEGLGLLAYNPLAGGLLTGKHRADAPPAEGTRFTWGPTSKRYLERYWGERQFATVEALTAVAREAGLDLATLSVAWLLSRPGVSTVIVGASRPQQIDASLRAADLAVPAEVLQRLDDLTAEYRRGDLLR